jgi:hypothetical protein
LLLVDVFEVLAEIGDHNAFKDPLLFGRSPLVMMFLFLLPILLL